MPRQAMPRPKLMAKTWSASMPTSSRALALLGQRADGAAEIGAAHQRATAAAAVASAPKKAHDLGQRQEGAEDLDVSNE